MHAPELCILSNPGNEPIYNRSIWGAAGLDEGFGPPSGASTEGHRSLPTQLFEVTGKDVKNSPNTH